jgi:hypothetical protein
MFNASNELSTDSFNASNANNFKLTKFQYDVGYAGTVAGVATANNTYNNVLAGNIISNNDSLLVTLNDTSSTFYLKMSFLNATLGSISPQLNYKLIVQNLITNIGDNNIKPACNSMYQLENSLFINNCHSKGKIIIYNMLGEIYFSINELKKEKVLSFCIKLNQANVKNVYEAVHYVQTLASVMH